MKNLIKLLIVLVSISLSPTLYGQNNDSKYLTGAVPELNGKVVFTKEFNIPNMSQDEIYERLLSWLDNRLKKNENNSRILYFNKEKGQIVGTGDEWIVFSSSALSLDRTRILYQPSITCLPAKCTIEVSKIRFIYREGEEKYTAEEWITDKYALNKSKTKLVRGLAKWRRKTVDFMDNFFMEAAEALSAIESPNEQSKTPSKDSIKTNATSYANSGPTLITSRKEVITNNASSSNIAIQKKDEVAIKSTNKATNGEVQPGASTSSKYKEVPPMELSADAIQTNAGKLVIVIGNDPFNMTMMTANSGGSLGKMNGKPVIFTILSPDQAYGQLESAETYNVRFYPNGSHEPSLILECKKLPAPTTAEGMPRTYIGEIIRAMQCANEMH